MNTNSRHLLILVFVLCFSAGSAAASEMRASVNTSRLALGDNLELTLTVDAASANAGPDLTPLQKDFRILRTGQNSMVNIVNGRRSESFSWVIALSPKEKGRLTIPAISAGNASSTPLGIEVVDASQLPAGTAGNGDLSMEITADPGAYYVQEEIPLTVRIQSSGGILQASLEEPSSSDFVLTKTGEDQVSNPLRNGRETTVIERHYYLKPQKSGKFTLPPLTLTATVENPSDRGSSLFDRFGGNSNSMFRMPSGASLFANMFSAGHELSVRSKPLELNVKPRPTGDTVWFLPAKQVELRAEWESAHPEFRVGEAVTRKISLFALGAAQEQLPDIPLADADGARIYLDRSSDRSTDTADGTAAIRQFDVSVVPTQAGEVSLPAIDVRWWDTTTDQQRVASLPAETLTVLPGSGVNTARAALPQAPAVASQDVNSTPDATTKPRASGMGARQWTEVALAVLLVLALTTITWLTRRRRRADTPAGLQPPLKQGESQLAAHEQAFIRACKSNDLRAAYTALNAWLQTASPLKEEHPATLAAKLAEMEAFLYSPTGKEGWSGRQVMRAFQEAKAAWRRSTRPASGSGRIPGLYPA